MIGRCLAAACAVWLMVGGTHTRAQSAEDIARMLVIQLSPTGAMEGGQWFTDATGAVGLGIIYAHIPGTAGSVSIHAGLFERLPTGWSIHLPVEGLLGMSPSNAVFLGNRVEVSTLMLGPEDPRCCPTLTVRWSIDVATGAARRLN